MEYNWQVVNNGFWSLLCPQERGIGTGTSPLFGQEMASDRNDSYVGQGEQH